MVGTIGRVLIGGVLLGSVLAGQKARAQPADARLDGGRFAASAPAETLLHVTKAGRFAISAQSSTGTALDLTEMRPGAHRFQIRMPLQGRVSRAVRIVVE